VVAWYHIAIEWKELALVEVGRDGECVDRAR